ncbi:MAG: prepilin-type N-terminal cleavage/methylation domain-containing protein [Planctomycetota bacterium]|jgi:prepilin-type N-terminal cleavage/methylation domain-containing protein
MPRRPSTTVRESLPRERAFSLIELVIVVVIIAVIAAIAVPRVTQASRNASAAAIAAHIRKLADAFELYHAEHGAWPQDSLAGKFPAEMKGRLRKSDFGQTPAGGLYDWQNWINKHPLGGCIMGIADGIHDWALLTQVDAILDDGDLQTGAFVRHSITNVTPNGTMAGLRLLIK